MIQILLYLSRETLKKGGLIIHHFLTTCCFLLILLFTSCNPKSDKSNTLVSVDIEANVNNMVPVNLSRFTDNIHYLPLETKDDIDVVYSGFGFDISNNLIITTDTRNNSVWLFDSFGHFISKFGNKGRGPGEYQSIGDLTFGKDKNIYFKSLYDLFEFNIDGSFVKKYSNTFMINYKYYIYTSSLVDDSLFFGHVPNSTGQLEYKALLVNKYGKVKQYYKNYILFDRGYSIASNFEGEAYYHRFKNKLFYKDINNDTLFYLNDLYQLIPKYAFKLGKFKMPLSERMKFPPSSKFIYTKASFQTENYLFLVCDFGDYFPAKRLTPKIINLPNNTQVTSYFNGRSVLGIFNKVTNDLTFCKPTSTDNPLFTSGLYNDVDAGPRFFPVKQVNDTTMVMWVKADELKNHVSSDEFKNNVPKYPEKKRQLEILANKLTEFDNPVLMFVTFKKER